MKVKEKNEKVGLKPNIKKKDHGLQIYHFIANRWWKSGNSVSFIFFGSKINTDIDCSHKIKRHSILGRIVMTNLDSVLKSRYISLLTKFCIVKAMVFQ